MDDSYGHGEYDYDGEYQVESWGEYGYGDEGYEGGYYDENGEWVYYDTAEMPAVQSVQTDIGEITYDVVQSKGMELIVDKEGRILNLGKLQSEDPNLPDSYEDFVTGWQPQNIAAVMDAVATSLCIWPTEPPPVLLKRFDVYENTSKVAHFGTTDPAESQRIRHSGDFIPVCSMMLYTNATSLTKTLIIEKVAPPLRSRFRMANGKNRRDVTKWYPAEEIQAFVQTTGSKGTIDYFIDWTDGPDRYYISDSLDPRAGWRRMWRFAGYPVTQYYILRRDVEHPDLEAEGGVGDTCNIVKGTTVFSRKRWKLVGSFYAFDLPLINASKYTVFTRQDPFHRMKLTLTEIDHPEEWTEQFSFWAFDIPLPGSCRYELQHCIYPHHKCKCDKTPVNHFGWQITMAVPHDYIYDACKIGGLFGHI